MDIALKATATVVFTVVEVSLHVEIWRVFFDFFDACTMHTTSAFCTLSSGATASRPINSTHRWFLINILACTVSTCALLVVQLVRCRFLLAGVSIRSTRPHNCIVFFTLIIPAHVVQLVHTSLSAFSSFFKYLIVSATELIISNSTRPLMLLAFITSFLARWYSLADGKITMHHRLLLTSSSSGSIGGRPCATSRRMITITVKLIFAVAFSIVLGERRMWWLLLLDKTDQSVVVFLVLLCYLTSGTFRRLLLIKQFNRCVAVLMLLYLNWLLLRCGLCLVVALAKDIKLILVAIGSWRRRSWLEIVNNGWIVVQFLVDLVKVIWVTGVSSAWLSSLLLLAKHLTRVLITWTIFTDTVHLLHRRLWRWLLLWLGQ